MNLSTLKSHLFTPYVSYRFSALPRAFPGHQLAMYALPFQSQYALGVWVIPNGRGGWKVAPVEDPGSLPAPPAPKPTRNFGPLGSFKIASPDALAEVAKPGVRFAAYQLPVLKKVAVCWLEKDDLDVTEPMVSDEHEQTS
ncbi:hypothetical protein LG293_16575 (plasmid) [Citricoccus nitrophenolicus]